MYTQNAGSKINAKEMKYKIALQYQKYGISETKSQLTTADNKQTKFLEVCQRGWRSHKKENVC